MSLQTQNKTIYRKYLTFHKKIVKFCLHSRKNHHKTTIVVCFAK
jgi:hypothetical protein